MNDHNDDEDPMNETPSKFTIDLSAPDLTQCPCHHCGVWRASTVFQAHAVLALQAGISLKAYIEGTWSDLPDEMKRTVVVMADIIPEGGPVVTTAADARNLLKDIAEPSSANPEFDYERAVAQILQALRPPQSEESDA